MLKKQKLKKKVFTNTKLINIKINETKQIVKDDFIACIGYFDGLHRMHKKLLSITKKIALKSKLKFMVITFSEKINHYLKNKDLSIFKEEYRIQNIIDFANPNILMNFTTNDSLINTSYEEFNHILLNDFNVKKIVVGSDFVYGQKAAGNIEKLKEFFEPNNIKILKRNNINSSSSLRECIDKGAFGKYNKMTNDTLKILVNKTKIDGKLKIINLNSFPNNNLIKIKIDGIIQEAVIKNNYIFIKNFEQLADIKEIYVIKEV